MKKYLKFIVSLLVVFMIFVGGFLFYLSRGLNTVINVVMSDVDLSTISDGTYNGQYNFGRWNNKVKVTVQSHKITEITVIDDVLFPKSEVTNNLIERVINEQSPNVDVVAGATVSCKAYLKSIENALTK